MQIAALSITFPCASVRQVTRETLFQVAHQYLYYVRCFYTIVFQIGLFLILTIIITTVVAPPRPMQIDFCNPSPCGPGAFCRNGTCSCPPEYLGDPYVSCRPECLSNAECQRNKACIRNKCLDPCIGTCGQSALCEVVNHVPVCSCPEKMTGNPFVSCYPIVQG